MKTQSRIQSPNRYFIKLKMFNYLLVSTLTLILFWSNVSHAQQSASNASTLPQVATTNFSLGVKGGYDYPLFNMPFQELTYNGNRYLGASADVKFPSNFGFRLDYANILTKPNIEIPSMVFYGSTPMPTTQLQSDLMRNWVGIGPSYTFGNSRFSVLTAPMVGYSWLKGGEAMVESMTPTGGSDYHLVNTGFDDQVLSAKMDVELNFQLSRNLSLTLSTYYMRHFGVHFDSNMDLNNMGVLPIAHGENIFDQTIPGQPYTVTSLPPNIIDQSNGKENCKDLSSVGATLGLKYTFGPRLKTEPKTGCNDCCPDDTHKVVVTVRDEISGKVIPKADVAIKDMTGNIVATGTTNAYGVVDFGEIHHGNYIATGLVYGIATTTDVIKEEEFGPNVVIQKEVLYNDLRFILKGVVVNKGTRRPEPNTVVSLTNLSARAVKQDNSGGKGEFTFRLDANSSYEVVGIKENRLSDIDRASTVGLTRSTTLFVDLELGVDNFDCDQGTKLDIKYDLDKAYLLTESKFELDRLVRYMKDHSIARVELSSHTDSRGSDRYNLDLSERRAKSAVEYIVSKGISRGRIVARGYGEQRLLNGCADGVNCSEADHRINRRTEAKLICN